MPNTLQDNPFLQVSFIDRVINDMVIGSESYAAIDADIPTVDQDPGRGTSIKWDVKVYDEGGMTPVVNINSTSPIVEGGAAFQKEWSPPHFREKVLLDGTDFLNIRRLGSMDQQKTLGECVVEWVGRLRRRIDNRQLWMKWQCVQSAIPVTLVGTNTTQRIDYSTFGLHPTPTVPWNAPGSTILDDIISFVSLFRNTGMRPRRAKYGTTVMAAMMSDPTVRTIIQEQMYRDVHARNILMTTPGEDGLSAFLQSMFAGLTFEYYSEGPPITLKVTKDVFGAVLPVAGATELFRVGETVDHILPNRTKTSRVITGVASDSITIAALAAVTSQRGTMIRKRYEFMDWDKFVIQADFPQGQSYGDKANFVTVANIHGEGGMENPQSGIASRVIYNDDRDPPNMEIIASFTGGPVVWYEDGPWLAAPVLA